ncbi:MAG: reverse transcriptase family protein [Mariniblastus sp.]
MLERFINWLLGGLRTHELARRLDLTIDELKSIDLTYQKFEIKKKSGKPRYISAPNAELKSLQRRILRRLLKALNTHPQATGFQPGVSFVDNARCHQSQAIVIRIDLVDFFPSILQKGVYGFFRRLGWDQTTSKLLANLTTHDGRLPQGAPTSPRLSNLMCVGLDFRMANLAEEHGAVYTRYADDITMSLGEGYHDVHELVGRMVMHIRQQGFQPHLKEKFDVRRQHQRQIVTGLVVNDQANLPREKRRWLRAVEHRMRLQEKGAYLGPNPSLTEEQLQGWQSLRKMINRDRVSKGTPF